MIRYFTAGAVKRLNPEYLNFLGRLIAIDRFGDRAHKASDILICEELEEYYDKLISIWPENTIVKGATKQFNFLKLSLRWQRTRF